MPKFKTASWGLLVVFLAFWCFGQSFTGNVNAATDVIVVDGQLTEGVWTGATKIEVSPDNPNAVYPGSNFNGPSDCKCDFALLWDATGFYVGSWFYDDVHYAPHASSIITAMQTHEDDGLEWWVTISWDNAYADPSIPYFGEFGWQLGKGFNTSEDIAGKLLHEVGGFVQSDVAIPADFTLKGFTEKYTSTDGLNFQSEALFTWVGDVMTNKGSAYEGDELGFTLGVNDNDDGGGDAQGNMRWAGGIDNWSSPESWAKVTLAGAPVITPKLLTTSKISVNEISGVYDIHGRLIRKPDVRKLAGIRFYMSKKADHMKRIIMR